MVSISSRLDRLKAKVPEPMTVICKLPTGEETVLPVDSCIQAKADFVRVKSGPGWKMFAACWTIYPAQIVRFIKKGKCHNMDKAHIQAQITRQRNKAAREAQRAEREAQEKQDRILVLEALRATLKDPEATTAQCLYAVTVLDNMQHYHLVPYGVRYPGQSEDIDIAEFKAAFLESMEQAKNE